MLQEFYFKLIGRLLLKICGVIVLCALMVIVPSTVLFSWIEEIIVQGPEVGDMFGCYFCNFLLCAVY